jgi:hypothetical protein
MLEISRVILADFLDFFLNSTSTVCFTDLGKLNLAMVVRF